MWFPRGLRASEMATWCLLPGVRRASQLSPTSSRSWASSRRHACRSSRRASWTLLRQQVVRSTPSCRYPSTPPCAVCTGRGRPARPAVESKGRRSRRYSRVPPGPLRTRLAVRVKAHDRPLGPLRTPAWSGENEDLMSSNGGNATAFRWWQEQRRRAAEAPCSTSSSSSWHEKGLRQ
jgi:hypothetical protein